MANQTKKSEVHPFVEKHTIYDSEIIEYFSNPSQLYEKHALLLRELGEKEKGSVMSGLLLVEVAELLDKTPLLFRTIASMMIQINNFSVINATTIGLLNQSFNDQKSLKRKVKETLVPLSQKLQEQGKKGQEDLDVLLHEQKHREEQAEKRTKEIPGVG